MSKTKTTFAENDVNTHTINNESTNKVQKTRF